MAIAEKTGEIPVIDIRRVDLLDRVRQQTREARLYESNIPFGDNIYRGATEYVRELLGLARFFEAGPLDLPVLDVGVGKGHAVEEFKQSNMGQKIHFKGTGLVSYRSLRRAFTSSDFYLTSAEFLKGIASQSVGKIIGVRSVSYSQAPLLVAERFDNVLVPGGLIKLSFPITDNKHSPEEPELARHLRERGYDIAISMQRKKHRIREVFTGSNYRIVLVAVKPDPTKDLTGRAQVLLDEDRETMRNQLRSLAPVRRLHPIRSLFICRAA